MQQHQQDLAASRVDVLVVTFETADIAADYAASLPWPVVIDRDRRLYRAYGMHRAGLWTVAGPASWWGYLQLLLRGRRLRRPTDDIAQLGGDVLIDPASTVRLHHVSENPLDRPSVERLLRIVQTGPPPAE